MPETPKTAFFVSTVTVKDGAKFQEYARRAAETLAAHGGALVLRGRLDTVLAGDADHQAVGIVAFPDADALAAWYASAAYQALIPLRDEAADMTLTAYSLPA